MNKVNKTNKMNEFEQRAAELLDDRLAITKMKFATSADHGMYNGMVQMLVTLDYGVVTRSGKHTVSDAREANKMDEYEQQAAQLLDDKLLTTKMPFATPADSSAYDGMMQMLLALGYDAIMNDGKHRVFDTKED